MVRLARWLAEDEIVMNVFATEDAPVARLESLEVLQLIDKHAGKGDRPTRRPALGFLEPDLFLEPHHRLPH